MQRREKLVHKLIVTFQQHNTHELRSQRRLILKTLASSAARLTFSKVHQDIYQIVAAYRTVEEVDQARHRMHAIEKIIKNLTVEQFICIRVDAPQHLEQMTCKAVG